MPQEILDDDFTNELSRACEIENFPPDTKLQYIRDMFTEMDYQAEMEAKCLKGFGNVSIRRSAFRQSEMQLA